MIAQTSTNALHVPELTLRSPAKINLTLEILSHRPDGFHDIRSVVTGIDLYDQLTFRLTDEPTVSLRCDDPLLPTDERNLVVRAANALRDRCKPAGGVAIDLSKRIPVAAGLGGGSGNAAVTLAALNKMWDVGLETSELAAIGAELGSDVPLFFSLPAAHISGRGEIVERLDLAWSGYVLLVFAGVPVDTGAVYAAWRPADVSDRGYDTCDAVASARTADEVAKSCVNDLEQAVFRVAPAVRDLYEAVDVHAPRSPRVTGAGQTVCVFIDDPEEAKVLGEKFEANNIGIGSQLVGTAASFSTAE